MVDHGGEFGRFRITPRTQRRPHVDRFDPRYALGAEAYEAIRTIERADQDLRAFAPGEHRARQILEDALTRNAYGTASIEGNPLTLDQVESLLARGPTPEALDRPDEREILNHHAWLRGIAGVPPPEGAADIAALHARLFAGVLPDAGAFKEVPNFIGRRESREVVYIPTPPERVAHELDAALTWLASAPEHPLIKAVVFFHEFQAIHPFRDGNGRIGRALTTWLLHAAGYHAVRYALVDYTFNEDREAYYAKLLEVEQNGWDLTPWVVYMLDILQRTFADAGRRFLFREALPKHLNARQVRVAEWFARLDQDRPGRRLKFNDIHAGFPAVAPRTLKRDLSVLRDAAILTLEGERRGARYFLTRADEPATSQ